MHGDEEEKYFSFFHLSRLINARGRNIDVALGFDGGVLRSLPTKEKEFFNFIQVSLYIIFFPFLFIFYFYSRHRLTNRKFFYIHGKKKGITESNVGLEGRTLRKHARHLVL